MMTVKQLSFLTGVSVRTLQFYDEIGLFKPTKITDAGYRLYDESALEVLQQILFFKELDFTLKEIKAIMENPRFDKTAAFQKQRELIEMKRDRLNALLGLLDKLIKGENCMDFKEFDMSEYFRILTNFKGTHTDKIVERLGSMEKYDEMLSDMKSRESEIAEMAVKVYGSLESFARAMEKSFEKFLDDGPLFSESEVKERIDRTEELTKRILADLSRDAASLEVQGALRELMRYIEESNKDTDIGANYWPFMAESYESNPAFIEATDKKYGEGAAGFFARAIRAHLDGQGS